MLPSLLAALVPLARQQRGSEGVADNTVDNAAAGAPTPH
jgi:hypothetical protein